VESVHHQGPRVPLGLTSPETRTFVSRTTRHLGIVGTGLSPARIAPG
jgi:hypothetical protein